MEELNREKKDDENTKKIVHTYPLIRHTDMNDDMRIDCSELCVTACEKFPTNNELAAKKIKEAMDNRYGQSWHVVVGEGFGFEVSYQSHHLLYMFFAGNLAICVWKCS